MAGYEHMQKRPSMLRPLLALTLLFAILILAPGAQARDYDIDRTMDIDLHESAFIDVEDRSNDWYINLTSNRPVYVYIIPPSTSLGVDPTQASLASASLKTWKNVSSIKDEVFQPNTDRDATDKMYKIYILNAGDKSANVTISVDNYKPLSTGDYVLFICICLAVVPLFILLLIVGIYFRMRRVQRKGLIGLFSRR